MRLSNLVKNLKLHKQPILKQGLDMLGVNLDGFHKEHCCNQWAGLIGHMTILDDK